jgi:hypothetical protein
MGNLGRDSSLFLVFPAFSSDGMILTASDRYVGDCPFLELALGETVRYLTMFRNSRLFFGAHDEIKKEENKRQTVSSRHVISSSYEIVFGHTQNRGCGVAAALCGVTAAAKVYLCFSCK